MASEFLLKKAHEFASFKHFYQFRKIRQEGYIKHPTRVAQCVRKFTNDKNLEIAAYIHDTVEDTPTTYKEIKAVFGEDIAKLVKELTSDKKELEKVGKSQYLIQKMNKMSDGAFTIKLCDRYDNTEDLPQATQQFRDKYVKQTNELLSGLSRKITPTQNKIISDIKKNINI